MTSPSRTHFRHAGRSATVPGSGSSASHAATGLEDPAGKGVESVRGIRDEIRIRVEALIAEVDAGA